MYSFKISICFANLSSYYIKFLNSSFSLNKHYIFWTSLMRPYLFDFEMPTKFKKFFCYSYMVEEQLRINVNKDYINVIPEYYRMTYQPIRINNSPDN